MSESTSKSVSKSLLALSAVLMAGAALVSCSDGASSPAASDATNDSVPTTDGTSDSGPPTSFDMDYMPASLVQMFEENSLFSTFAELVALTDLAPLFEADGEITIFLPPNAAFERLPAGTVEKLKDPKNRELLTRLLSFHLLDGKVTEMQVTAGTLTMKSGDTVNVEVGPDVGYMMNIKINGTTVVVGDLFAGKSVAHVLSDVMVPPGIDLSTL